MKEYNFREIEKKWAQKWVKDKTFTPDLEQAKNPFYALYMFPYPSADGLHIGNFYAFVCTDVMAKYKKLNGLDVFEPFGFDAFGIHSENYALKIGETPQKMLERTTNNFRKQVQAAGLSCDYTREVNTTKPEYYKWTQWIFTKLFERGLAYQKEALVNWCSSCKTVLSDEQVIDGECERCGTKVEKKKMKQWFFKITAYAQRLLDGLEEMDWSDITKAAQRNWIGRSEGAKIRFSIVSQTNADYTQTDAEKSQHKSESSQHEPVFLEVFTTRPDTLFGATYLVLSPEHTLIKREETRIKNKEEVEEYIKKAQAKSELERTENKEKTGVKLEGIEAINPVNGEKLPIWIADYVLSGYGTGAIMAVPAHDERDFEFAKKYNLPIAEVVKGGNVSESAFAEEGININSGFLDGLETEKAKKKMIEWLEENNVGKGVVNYRLRDWCISRQRYWGPPVPVVYCEKCAKNKEQVLILHGWEATSKSDFFPSLKENLFSKNYDVFAFDAPNTEKPKFEEWFDFIEQKIEENNLNNFHVIGHSMGGHLAAKIAEKYKLKSLTLIVPVGFNSSEDYFKQFVNKLSPEEINIFKAYQSRKLDIEKVKNNVKKINIVFGKDDPWITREIREFYSNNFNKIARIDVLPNKGHMSEEEGIKRVEFIENLFDFSNPGVMAVSEKDLPVLLPELEKGWEPTGDGRGPLAKVESFMKTTCPICGGPAEREADVMDNFLDSAWYFFRYVSPHDDKEIFDPGLGKKWLPVDLYVGGNEHAVLHLMYTRFITMALHDLGLVDFDNPFKKFRANGMIQKDGKKMSKSKGNIIKPEDYGEKVGYDALKTYLLFLGPLSEDRSFTDQGVLGCKRWVEKVSRLEEKVEKNYQDESAILRKLHQAIKKIGEEFEEHKYNTIVARLMELTNELTSAEKISLDTWKKYLVLVAPYLPALSEELWSKIGNEDSIFSGKNWPEYDAELAKDEEIELVVQINGKLRDRIKTDADISEKEAKELALQSEKIRKFLEGQEPKKIIFVKGKLINIVL